MSKTVLVPVANGTEELEAISIIDILRRAGAEVCVASVHDLQITASKGTRIVADCLIAECLDMSFDLIVIPGGIPGSEHLRDSEELTKLMKKQASEDKLYGAICAAPVVVLQHHGLLKEKATSYPAFLPEIKTAKALEDKVVVDGNVITSRGAGTALDFSLKLVELLYGAEKAEEVARSIVAI